MRILLTNDDGIHAEGLAALERDRARAVGRRLGRRAGDRAVGRQPGADAHRAACACAGSMTRRFAVSGTPTDCVMLAVQDLIEGAQPDLVLSGVNRGQNLAEDVTMSGTVAGAIEGMALGVPVDRAVPGA